MNSIWFFIFSLTKGGAEQTVVRIANHWAENGKEVTIYTFKSEVAFEVSPLVKVHCLHLSGQSTSFWEAIRSNLKRVFRIRSLIKQSKPETVISFMPEMNCTLILATIGMGTNLLISDRNNPTLNYLPMLWRIMRRALYPFQKKFVVQTHGVTRHYWGFYEPHVIPNPVPSVEETFERSYEKSDLTLLAVGRLQPQKGFDRLLEAFAKTKTRNLKLVILGEGSERNELEKQIAKHRMANRVTLAGRIEEPAEYYRSADVFFLSSRFEGFPNVLLEAMTYGLPVISTNCDYGPSDIIENGVDGVLVESDQWSSWAKLIDDVFRDHPKLLELGAAAKAKSKKFEISSVALLWEQLALK